MYVESRHFHTNIIANNTNNHVLATPSCCSSSCCCCFQDPLLAEHLSHWGIDIMRLEKTEKTLGETELEKNLQYDWSLILEEVCEAYEASTAWDECDVM